MQTCGFAQKQLLHDSRFQFLKPKCYKEGREEGICKENGTASS
jgi:hypothetical protein